MFFDILFYFQGFCMSPFLFVLVFKHVLIVLMILEVVIMNICVLMFLSFSLVGEEFYMVYYLVFSVCESVLGIVLLILVVRSSGNDLYYLYNMGKF